MKPYECVVFWSLLRELSLFVSSCIIYTLPHKKLNKPLKSTQNTAARYSRLCANSVATLLYVCKAKGKMQVATNRF